MTVQQQAPIGVLDSGVGGLSVLKCLQSVLPHENFIYVGDTARTPYGPRSEAEVRKFVGEMLDYLAARGVKLVVVACNTLTVLGVDTLKGNHEFELVGMSKGVELVLNASKNKKIGILATEFTIKSGAHRKAILAATAKVEIYPQACPKFVPLIESEQFESNAMKMAIEEYTEPLKATGVDTVILSCTHYPFIKEKLIREFGNGVAVIDPAEATAQDVKEKLLEQGLLQVAGKSRCEICFTADKERGQRLAEIMLSGCECEFAEINLQRI